MMMYEGAVEAVRVHRQLEERWRLQAARAEVEHENKDSELMATKRALRDAHAERDVVKAEFGALQMAYDRLLGELLDSKIVLAQHQMEGLDPAPASIRGPSVQGVAHEVEARVQELQRDHTQERWKERCLRTEKESHSLKQLIGELRQTIAEAGTKPHPAPTAGNKAQGAPRETTAPYSVFQNDGPGPSTPGKQRMRSIALEGAAPRCGSSPTQDAYQEACLQHRNFRYQAGELNPPNERDVLAKYIDGVSGALAYRPWKAKAASSVRYASEG